MTDLTDGDGGGDGDGDSGGGEGGALESDHQASRTGQRYMLLRPSGSDGNHTAGRRGDDPSKSFPPPPN